MNDFISLKKALIFLTLTLSFTNIWAQTYTLTDADVMVEGGIITSCSYNFELTDIIIPETLDGQTIVAIADAWSSFSGIFSQKGISSIEFPATLEKIGAYAFYDNDISGVDLSVCPGIDTIGISAFYLNTNLSSLNLSGCSSLLYFGDAAFQSNAISNLDFSDCSSLLSISAHAFSNNNISSLNLSACTLLTHIGDNAFSGNSISLLDISSCTALANIGEYAFSSNSIAALDLSTCTGLRFIGSYAFQGNLVTEFALPEVLYEGTWYTTWVDREANNYTAGVDPATDLTTFYVPLITYTLKDEDVEVEEGVITSCSYDFELKSIIIPQNLDGQTVLGIADGNSFSAVFSNKGIIGVDLPSSIQNIGDYAFYRNELANLALADHTALTSIGHQSFSYNAISDVNLSGCSALASVGNSAFSYNQISTLNVSGCSALTSMGSSAFFSNQIASLDLSACTTLETIGEMAFLSNAIATLNLTGCSGLRLIGNRAFSGNPLPGFLLPVVLHDGTSYDTWVDGEANTYLAGVDMASNLETFYVPSIPYTLTDEDVEMEEGVITSCSYDFELKNIVIPQTLDGQTVVGIKHGSSGYWGVFNSKGITAVEFPSTLKFIGDYAFYQNEIVRLDFSVCTGLDTIGRQAFYSNNLESVDLTGCNALTLIDASAFYGNSITALDLSDGAALESIGESAFHGNEISDLDLSNCKALRTIGEMAFLFNSIASLNLTGCLNLRMIGYRAFAVNPLTEFELPEVSYEGEIYNVWVDREANSYTAGVDPATNLETFYVPFIPYTLTDEDVEVEDGMITNCSYDFELKYMIVPPTLDGQSVTGIAGTSYYNSGIFQGNGIILVDLPSSIESIGAYAFYQNEIASLDLSDCQVLTSIGESAFEYNVIQTIDLTGCHALASLGESAFSYNDITALDLSDCSSLKSFGEYAFAYNELSTLDLSPCKVLASIGDFAFHMSKLSSLNLNGCTGLRYVGSHAFFEYSSTLTYTLPEVIYEGSSYNIWIDEEINSYSAGTDMITNLESFYVPFIPYTLEDDDVEILNGVIMNCSYDFELKNIIIPQILDGETVVGIAGGYYSDQGVFNYKGITSLELPASIKNIGDYAFTNNQLYSIDFSSCTALASIGESAFSSNSIASLDLSGSASLISIGRTAFRYNKLTSFNLPDPVIPDYYYSNWQDDEGGMYSGGDLISNLYLGYKRIMPEISQVDPVFAPTSGNLEVTFKGENFENERHNKALLFNGTESLAYTFWNDTMIRVNCPPNPEGPAKIEMVLENNLSYYSKKQFFYSDEDIVVVCGNVSGLWESGKIYLLQCDVRIPEGDALIIEEGVRVLAMPDEQIQFSCEGTLEVRGTEADPVSFSSTTEVPGSWDGIKVYGTHDDCSFRYCIIESATTALSLVGWAYGCGSDDNYSLIENCMIRNNTESGIYCRGEGDYLVGCTFPKTGVSSPTIKNCQIYNNGGEGIKLYAYDGYMSNGYVGANIYNNLIYNNKNGIHSSGSDPVEPKITNNVIAENTHAGIYNRQWDQDLEDYIVANNVFLNNGSGVINEDTSSIVLYNNGFWSNSENLSGDLQDEANIFADPLFEDAENHDYHLTVGSPCIDAGENSFAASEQDYFGRARIWDGNDDQEFIIDMGIAEFGAGCYLAYEEISICEGESIQVGDSVFSESGTYVVEMTDQSGCDSIIHLDLIVISVNTGVTASGDTLSAEASGAGYRWLNCDSDYALISGARNQSYIATIDGNYAVEVSYGGCIDTSECFFVDVEEIGISDYNDFGPALLVYPNPTDEQVRIELGDLYQDVRLRVFNAAGQVVSDRKYGNVRMVKHELKGDPGRYIFRIDTREGKSSTFNIIKN